MTGINGPLLNARLAVWQTLITSREAVFGAQNVSLSKEASELVQAILVNDPAPDDLLLPDNQITFKSLVDVRTEELREALDPFIEALANGIIRDGVLLQNVLTLSPPGVTLNGIEGDDHMTRLLNVLTAIPSSFRPQTRRDLAALFQLVKTDGPMWVMEYAILNGALELKPGQTVHQMVRTVWERDCEEAVQQLAIAAVECDSADWVATTRHLLTLSRSLGQNPAQWDPDDFKS